MRERARLDEARIFCTCAKRTAIACCSKACVAIAGGKISGVDSGGVHSGQWGRWVGGVCSLSAVRATDMPPGLFPAHKIVKACAEDWGNNTLNTSNRTESVANGSRNARKTIRAVILVCLGSLLCTLIHILGSSLACAPKSNANWVSPIGCRVETKVLTIMSAPYPMTSRLLWLMGQ